jgi:hypothetical protein
VNPARRRARLLLSASSSTAAIVDLIRHSPRSRVSPDVSLDLAGDNRSTRMKT